MLANIFYMKNDISSAKDCLENVCPLMELLPGSLQESKRYSDGCFSLLREIYNEIQKRKQETFIENEHSIGRRLGNNIRDRNKKKTVSLVDDTVPSSFILSQNELRRGRRVSGVTKSNQPTGFENDKLKSKKLRDCVKYCSNDDLLILETYPDSSDTYYETIEIIDCEGCDDLLLKSSGSDSYHQDGMEDKGDLMEDFDKDYSSHENEEEIEDSDTTSTEDISFNDNSDVHDTDSDDASVASFDIDLRIEELRAPFDHLRSELRQQQGSNLVQPPIQFMESPLLISNYFDENDAAVLILNDGELGEIQADIFSIGGEHTAASKDFGFSNMKLNNEMQQLVQSFVHENEGGREKVLAKTKRLIDTIRHRLIDEVFIFLMSL